MTTSRLAWLSLALAFAWVPACDSDDSDDETTGDSAGSDTMSMPSTTSSTTSSTTAADTTDDGVMDSAEEAGDSATQGMDGSGGVSVEGCNACVDAACPDVAAACLEDEGCACFQPCAQAAGSDLAAIGACAEECEVSIVEGVTGQVVGCTSANCGVECGISM